MPVRFDSTAASMTRCTWCPSLKLGLTEKSWTMASMNRRGPTAS